MVVFIIVIAVVVVERLVIILLIIDFAARFASLTGRSCATLVTASASSVLPAGAIRSILSRYADTKSFYRESDSTPGMFLLRSAFVSAHDSAYSSSCPSSSASARSIARCSFDMTEDNSTTGALPGKPSQS
jgi:hypothetical protein